MSIALQVRALNPAQTAIQAAPTLKPHLAPLLVLEEQIRALAREPEKSAPRGARLGVLKQRIFDREIGAWHRFNNRRQVGSYARLCPGFRVRSRLVMRPIVTPAARRGIHKSNSVLKKVRFSSAVIPSRARRVASLGAS